MRRSFGSLPGLSLGRACSTARTSSLGSSFSTSSSGRGRGRGLPADFSRLGVTPGNSKSDDSNDQYESNPTQQPPTSTARGRGRGTVTVPTAPTSFHPFVNPSPASSGRGRGGVSSAPPSHAPLAPKGHILFTKEQTSSDSQGISPNPPSKAPFTPKKAMLFTKEQESSGLESEKPIEFSKKPEELNLPSGILPVLSGLGRGKPIKSSLSEGVTGDQKPKQENRHIRRQAQAQALVKTDAPPKGPKLSQDDAVKKAKEILSKGDDGGVERGGGRGSRGRGRGGRGRGNRFVEDDGTDDDDFMGNEVQHKANEEMLAKRLGPEKMNTVVEAFEDIADRVLPSPANDAYINALHTNLMIECEPEYMLGEFDQNPDIDEKPPMPLPDFLEKVKPFIMSYEGIQSQEEWEEAMKETMENVPLMKEIVDFYSGPDRVTAKRQQEELERVAKTLPASAPTSVKRFTDRAVLSLQSNPGWGFDKKCQFMDKLVWEASQQYK